MRWHFFKTCL